jgi:MFS family permease
MSTIWFVIPLQIAKLGGGAQAGLGLGIYELVTIFFAGMAGFLADTYNWRLSNTLGWILIAGGGIALAAFPTLTGLIISGSVIAIGNNLAHYASAHALETYDKDHREDGSFMAFGNMLENLGWGFSPLLVGYLYAKFGFDTSLLFCTAIAILSALVMIPLTWQVKHKCSAKLKLKC